jgi:hypothetical protein
MPSGDRRNGALGSSRPYRVDRRQRIHEPSAELAVAALRSEIFCRRHEDAPNLGGRERWIAIEQQCRHPADLSGRDGSTGGELVTPVRCGREDFNPGGGNGDVVAAIGAGKQCVVGIRRRDRNDVRIGRRKQWRRSRPALPAAAISTMPLA